LPFEGLSFKSAYEAEGAAMSQSSSGAPGWQLEGNAPLAYDTHIVDVFLQHYSRRLVEVAAIKPGDRVLDVACGTGVVTRLLANKIDPAGQVVAKEAVGREVIGPARRLAKSQSSVF
jgi:2-polyprenyl-3-methyl-5-hydroxy-6-metoxy-1,4-benzoquinol methylase